MAKKIRTIETGVALVRHGIDYQIRTRGGIDNQINKAAGDFIGGVVKGLADVAVSRLAGIWQVVTNPIEMGKGIFIW